MTSGKHKHDKDKEIEQEPEVRKEEATTQEPVTGEQTGKAAEQPDQAEKLAQLESELAAMNDKYLRLYSEFDNFRKRTLREKIEMSKTASAEVITLLLPVIDDLERAIRAHSAAGESAAALTEGITLIYNKMMTLLGQQGLEAIAAPGEEFNTDFHEAVTNIPATGPEMKGKVVDEIQKGYTLNGKVIRFAKVVVGS